MKPDANLIALDNGVLAHAVASTNSPLIITDNLLPDNPIIFANQAFLNLSGMNKSEIIGHNCRFLQGEDTDKETVTRIRKAVKKGESIRVNLKNYRKDGSAFWNDLLISPIINDEGVTTHFIGMQLDITDRIEYTELLERAQKQLRESNEELEQFTYAASHDLQEPLRMVSSYLQLLDKRYGETFDDNARMFLDFAHEGASRMQQLIDDLLVLSRISTVTHKFKLTPFSEVIKRAQFNLKLLIDETETTFTIRDMPDVLVDSTQMVQLMQNLIGNAIKYRQPGIPPHIEITTEQTDNSWTFSVTDNGIGIEPQYHHRIFVIFQRLHTRDEYAGTGVGLAICSKIIERHDGKIWVESAEGQGATFKFSLPITRKEVV